MTRLGFALAGAAALMTAQSAMAGTQAMMTEWGAAVTPENAWREYPRPQMVRAGWQCLNGLWDYAVTSVTNTPGRPERWDGRILVPFAVESPLSGVGRLLKSDELLWYTRTFDCDPRPGRRTLLHFDGVDFRAMVFVGHAEVTDVPHAGAQEPFTLDVTDFVKKGPNQLTVCVWDPTQDFVNSHGKQCTKPGGCFYTRVSGIWQSVWLETVPETYVADYNVVTDIRAGKAVFDVKLAGRDLANDVRIEVTDPSSRKVVATASGRATAPIEVRMPAGFRLWSPEEPNLYDVTIRSGADEVKGYFGMRSFAKTRDAKGVWRFALNGRLYYPLGTLDQGWWPDGLLTPPSDAAMVHDIETLKRCGFNMMRKHIKVEPRRYYYHCDRLGILVWQDLPSVSNGDDHRETYRTGMIRRYGFQRQELKAMIDNLRKVTSIVTWVPYNEAWGQPGEFLTHATQDWVKRYDPTRLVNGPSGWNDYEGGCLVAASGSFGVSRHEASPSVESCVSSDIIDCHCYRGPAMCPVNPQRVSFLGEFGGLGHAVEGHLWRADGGSWGYGGTDDTKTREGLQKVYLGLMNQLRNLARKGCAGAVYTQTTDVETEINGLMTYDRKVLKFDAAVLKAAHAEVIRAGTEIAP